MKGGGEQQRLQQYSGCDAAIIVCALQMVRKGVSFDPF